MRNILIAGFFTGAVAALVACQPYVEPARDETDSPTHRSGVAIVTDYGTGCQYLVTPRVYKHGGGGITPRLSPDGKPICRPQQMSMPSLSAWSPNKKVAI